MKSKYKWTIAVIGIIIVLYFIIVPGLNTERMDIVGSTSVQPLAEELVESYMGDKTGLKVNVQGGGSGMGIRSANQDIADIGMSSKDLSDSEKKGMTLVELGKEGIVIGVNNNNLVEDLSKDQLQSIFNGTTRNWKEVGGQDLEIHVISREDGSGTRSAFESLVMKDSDVKDDAIIQSSTESVKQAVASDPGAIGYMSYAHMSDDVKSISVGGVSVSENTIVDGSYDLQRPFLFIINGEPSGEVQKFLDWIKSPKGQDIIKNEKIIPSNGG